MLVKTYNGMFNRDNLALYRYQKDQQFRASHPNFYFGHLTYSSKGRILLLRTYAVRHSRLYAGSLHYIVLYQRQGEQ